MAEDLVKINGSKKEMYQNLIPQIVSLCEGEYDVVANMGNICAALKELFDFLWVGFYCVKNDELVLGPFQGPVACTRIPFGKGVCGKAWENAELINVSNVHEFPGHIACSSFSNSEIVIPLMKAGQVWAILDIDSKEFSAFDSTDEEYLTNLCTWFSEK